jgi:hypothetical protein
VLVGTQAVLRLPPLPRLSLVALTAGDALHDHEDVRAEEGSLRTLLALPDLAPPGRRPLVVAQVHRPEHDVWRAWLDPDLDAAVDGFLARVPAAPGARLPAGAAWARVQLTHREPRAVAEAARPRRPPPCRRGAGRATSWDRRRRRWPGCAGASPTTCSCGPTTTPALAARVAGIDLRPGGGVQVRVDVDPYDVETWLD